MVERPGETRADIQELFNNQNKNLLFLPDRRFILSEGVDVDPVFNVEEEEFSDIEFEDNTTLSQYFRKKKV